MLGNRHVIMPESMIAIKGVWKIYTMGANQVVALKDISFDIHEGEFVAVVGPSGSGKSTMMHIVGCLDLPTKGSVYLKGRNISAMSESSLAALRGRHIGFIFQQFNLIPTLTALENVALPMIFQETTASVRNDRATLLLTKFGLRDRMYHKPAELSGGQSQRVAISRALANDPEIILADEPTGNLDSKTGAEVMNALAEIHRKQGKTIILVTHDLNLVHHAERVIYLKDGMVEKIVKKRYT